MRNLKILILAFGALGIVSLFIPIEGASLFEAMKAQGTEQPFIMIGAFALAAVMGLLGIMKPPAAAWQGIVALAGFALAAVKLKLWETIGDSFKGPLAGKLLAIAVIGGVVVSLLAAIKPENKS